MSKTVLFGKNAQEKMLRGFDQVADAVAGTLGPKGGNVYIGDAMLPEITNDGVTIATKITLNDLTEELGAYIVKNTSAQTNDDAGDGTTTTAVLLQATVHECLKHSENPMEIRASLKEACEKVLKTLAKKSKKISQKDVETVALVSSENKELAKLISEIVHKLGEKAVINVEDSKTFGTDYEIVDGYEIPIGFMSPHFINDKKTNKAVYEDVPVLVSEKKISNVQEIAPIFEQFANEKINSCVIVCEDIDDSMLGLLVINKNMGRFSPLVIRATGSNLTDIEGATGATAISDKNGITFQTFKTEHLGKAKKVICDANKTLFLGSGVAAQIYAKKLDKDAENESNMYQKQKIKERAARLRGGVAVLRIGAPTDLERVYLRRKAEDAVKATQAALEEGIVEGGGMALWRIAKEMQENTIGNTILKRALTAPLRKIIENAGKEYADIIQNMPHDKGYDAKNDTYVYMLAEGIIDPTKVERVALENAVSSASTFITAFCAIVDYQKPDELS